MELRIRNNKMNGFFKKVKIQFVLEFELESDKEGENMNWKLNNFGKDLKFF